MKTKKLFFIAFVLCFISSVAFAQTAEHKTYDYVTIVVEKVAPKNVYISDNGGKYEQIRVRDSVQGDYDYNKTINIIKKYEKEGYEIFASNLAIWGITEAYTYFLLRKEHKE